jgi:hypothetical protein
MMTSLLFARFFSDELSQPPEAFIKIRFACHRKTGSHVRRLARALIRHEGLARHEHDVVVQGPLHDHVPRVRHVDDPQPHEHASLRLRPFAQTSQMLLGSGLKHCFTVYLSQEIEGIRHFLKCLGNCGNPSIANETVGISGISGNAQAIGGIFDSIDE